MTGRGNAFIVIAIKVFKAENGGYHRMEIKDMKAEYRMKEIGQNMQALKSRLEEN